MATSSFVDINKRDTCMLTCWLLLHLFFFNSDILNKTWERTKERRGMKRQSLEMCLSTVHCGSSRQWNVVSVIVQFFSVSLCAQYTGSCELKQGRRRVYVIVWKGLENMADRGQKASCACSHGYIKQGMKYSNTAVHLFRRKLHAQRSFYQLSIRIYLCTGEYFSNSGSTLHTTITNNSQLQWA